LSPDRTCTHKIVISGKILASDLTGITKPKCAAQYPFRYFFRQTDEFSRFRENYGSSGITRNSGE
ncbi:hypothetical protein ACTNCI_12455, partial [Mitsuokella jalaludinii]|uniref:hypothetical protein n=1 Tax=Mitsuokella jalaludinii TaxID=187979 RepID=UPI003F88B4DA